MKIGINLLALLPGVSGGIEFYIRNLLASLAQIDKENHYYLFVNQNNHHTFHFNQANFECVDVGISARPQFRRVAWEQIYLPVAASKLNLNILHSPTYTWPVYSGVPGVVTICDMLYRVYPGFISEPKLTFWKVFIPWSVRRCRKVITISENSKKDIVHYLHIKPEKVVVTPLALDKNIENIGQPSRGEIDDVCSKYGIKRPYIISVGGVGKHKNPISLVRALSVLNRRLGITSLSLVITGNDYGAKRKIEAGAASLGIEKFVHLPGYVPREDLPALYSGAISYVSTSYFEGFGLTVLEAMACGTPVVTSDRASLPEVVGDAATIVDPDSTDQLVEAIYRLLLDEPLRDEMIRRGYRRVKNFSWGKTAKLTLETYREVAGNNKSD